MIHEPNFGDGMFGCIFEPILKKVYSVTLTESDRAVGQKERRIIDVLEPVIQAHKLVVAREVIEDDFNIRDATVSEEKQKQYMLFHQMTRITKDRGSLAHDDRLDVVAMAVKYWTDNVNPPPSLPAYTPVERDGGESE